MDGIFLECSLSQMETPDEVLAGARRVLKPLGYLIVSDLYARNVDKQIKAPPGRSDWTELISGAGFSCLLFEDRSEELIELISQLLWRYNRSILNELCTYDEAALKASRCGYFLLIAQKEGD
jgi:SAM-dependent methyltransferase